MITCLCQTVFILLSGFHSGASQKPTNPKEQEAAYYISTSKGTTESSQKKTITQNSFSVSDPDIGITAEDMPMGLLLPAPETLTERWEGLKECFS